MEASNQLFNCIAGFYRPEAGRLSFLGQSLVGRSPDRVCRLGIARTFQLSRSFADLTVAQNVAVGVLYGNAGIGDSGIGTTLTGNVTNANASDGIEADPTATIARNTANYNTGYGIKASPGGKDGGGNLAKGNTQATQCKDVVCS